MLLQCVVVPFFILNYFFPILIILEFDTNSSKLSSEKDGEGYLKSRVFAEFGTQADFSAKKIAQALYNIEPQPCPIIFPRFGC